MLVLPPASVLKNVPGLYTNDAAGVSLADTVIHLHFFIGGCDWYLAEFDGDDLFWGYVNLNDPEMAEWGYVAFSDLKNTVVQAPLTNRLTGERVGSVPAYIEYDQYWKPVRFREMDLER